MRWKVTTGSRDKETFDIYAIACFVFLCLFSRYLVIGCCYMIMEIPDVLSIEGWSTCHGFAKIFHDLPRLCMSIVHIVQIWTLDSKI